MPRMHPVLFTLHFGDHHLPFFTYGFFLGWAFFCAAQTGAYFGGRDGMSRRIMLTHAALVIFFGYIGSHFHYILTQPPEQRRWGDMLSLRYDGFTFYGAILAGTISGIPVARFLKIPFWAMSDAAAVSIAIAHGIGRIGCFFRGCDYGVLAEGNLAWLGVSYPPAPNVPGVAPGELGTACDHQIQAGLLPPGSPWSRPVVATQLIEVLVELSMAAALWFWLTRPRRPRAGTAFLVWWVVYGVLRAAIEQLRGDQDRGTLLGVSTSTAIGLLTSVAGLVFLVVPPLVRIRPERAQGPPPAAPGATSPAPGGEVARTEAAA